MKILLKNLAILFLLVYATGCNNNKKTEVTEPKASFNFDKEAETTIINREISSWEFAQNKDFAKLQEVWGPDYSAFFGDHSLSAEEAIKSFATVKINNYRLYNIKVKPVAENTAIIYYNLQQDVSAADGSKWIPEVAASSVYVKRGTLWQNVFYHETPVDTE